MTQPGTELQGQDWAGEMGEKWNAHLDTFESMIAAVGAAAVRFGDFRTGESVLDIGAGGGITSFEIAELVGPSGHVTGLDLSPVLVETARRRAAERGLASVDFVCGDAAAVDLERTYDCLFSRFGVMFFDDPYAAFAHMHGFGKPGARLRFCCWGPPPANPWMADVMETARRHVEIPEPEDPKAPGPFAFADRDYVTDILQQAGFTQIEFTEWTGEQLVGGAGATPESAARFLLDVLLDDALAEADDPTKAALHDDLVALLARSRSERGIPVRGHAWLVGARC